MGLLRSLVECCVCARVLVKQAGFRVGFRFMVMSVSFFSLLVWVVFGLSCVFARVGFIAMCFE